MRRTIAALALGSLLAAGCAAAPAGPRDPVGQDRLSGDEATNSTGARATAIAFVHAYGMADPAGLAAMTALAGSAVMRQWVHWQGVQLAEFPGSISGSVDLRSASVAQPVVDIPGTSTVLREISLDDAIRFDYAPTDGEPFSSTRSIEGIRVARNEGSPWVVVNLVRDGVPISTLFQPVGATVKGGGVSVELDSFVADQASGAWQFDLIVSGLHGSLTLDPASAALIGPDGTQIATATSVSTSLASVDPGRPVEGLVRFDALEDATGVTLRLSFAGSGATGAAEFPLQDLITPVAAPSPSSVAPSPSPAA